jgi:hypothetical protein
MESMSVITSDQWMEFVQVRSEVFIKFHCCMTLPNAMRTNRGNDITWWGASCRQHIGHVAAAFPTIVWPMETLFKGD